MEASAFPTPDSKTCRLRPGLSSPAGPSAAAGRAPELPALPLPPADPPRRSAATVKQAFETEADPAAVPEQAEPTITTCPRCGGKLIDPEGLGWCQGCGYCHSLEQDRAKVRLQPPPAARPPKDPSPLEFILLLKKVPSWFWTMMAGAGLIVMFTILTDQPYRKTPVARMIWSTVQIVLGFFMTLGASFWALITVASADEGISIKNMVFQGRVWALTFQRLPKTRWQVWLAAWGIAAVLSAAFLIGGLKHWFRYLPKASTAQVPRATETRVA
jgi:hypothetical protein